MLFFFFFLFFTPTKKRLIVFFFSVEATMMGGDLHLLRLTLAFPDGTHMGNICILRTDDNGYTNNDMPFYAVSAKVVIKVRSTYKELTDHNYHGIMMSALCLGPFLKQVQRTFAKQTCFQHTGLNNSFGPATVSLCFPFTSFHWDTLTTEACEEAVQVFGQPFYQNLMPIPHKDVINCTKTKKQKTTSQQYKPRRFD